MPEIQLRYRFVRSRRWPSHRLAEAALATSPNPPFVTDLELRSRRHNGKTLNETPSG